MIVLGHREEEVRLLEVLNHVPNVVLNGHKLSLDILDLVILFLSKCVTLLNLLGKFVAHILLFFFGKLTQFLVPLDFLFDLLVLLLNHIDFGVDLVHVVIEGIILLISLDEGCHDFLD